MDNVKNYLNEQYNFNNQVILITGASGQIGSAIITKLINLNANVIAIDLNMKDLEKTAKKLNWSKQKVLLLNCDVRHLEEVKHVIQASLQKYKYITSLINNAGVSVFEPFLDREESSIDWVMDVNLKGTIFFTKEFLKYKKNNPKKGTIVNIGSHYGIISPDPRIYKEGDRKNSEVYGATKAGIIQMTKYFAVHASEYNVTVNSVSPGGVYNPDNPQGEFFQKNYNYRCPMGRMADTSEIVSPIIFLLSSASSYINGHNLIVDGGMSVW